MPLMPDIPKAEAAIIEQTNLFRAANGQPKVAGEPALTKAAREYARFLAASPIFSHEADGRRSVDRIKAAGYQPCTTAENLAVFSHPNGFETLDLATKMVEGWKKSPGHARNLLLPPVTETGVAIAKSRREEKYFSVQLFARPGSLSFTFEIVNSADRSVNYTLGTETRQIEPRVARRHTQCAPESIEFSLKPAGALAKGVTARYETRAGQVFRLSASKRGEITVNVDAK